MMKFSKIITLLIVLPLVAFAKPVTTTELEITRPLDIKVYAEQQVVDRWNSEQWDDFKVLIHRESTWRHLAQNPKTTAFGYGQFLDSTWKIVGCEKTIDKYIQIDCTIDYIDLRYKTPEKALSFHRQKNWY